MISINATLFIQIINFLILVFILKRFMYGPIMKLINDRIQYVEDAKIKIENIETETAELVDKCVSMEKAARADAGNESAQMKKEANLVAEQIFEETREEVADIRKKAEQEITGQIENARQFLRDEAVALSDAITEKVMGRRAGN